MSKSMPQPRFLSRLDKQAAIAETRREAFAAEQDAKRKKLDADREELAKLVNDSTDKNRQFFALYLGLLVYVLLMVFGTTDQMLLVPTQGIKLPLVDVTLPLFSFYWVAPLFLLVIHFNLLQNLESHHYKLMRWQEVCDGMVPRRKIPAFLFDYEWLERGSKMEHWVALGSRVLFLHSGPFALGILLWRFTDYQDLGITTWHLFAFFFDSYLVCLTNAGFKKNEQPDQLTPVQVIPLGVVAKLRMVADMFVCFWRHLFDYTFHLIKTFWYRSFGMMILLQFGLACWIHFITDGFQEGWLRLKNYPSLFIPIIVIDPNETAWQPEKKDIEIQALLAGENEVAQWWGKHGEGLNLEGRHLRGFSAIDAHLPKLKLNSGSDLQGANFSGAMLQGAQMSYARLQGAQLSTAQLQGANLVGAKLQNATLWGAALQGAKLGSAKLQGANLTNAQLQGADLDFAGLQGASLYAAGLQGVLLAGAQLQGANLNSAQLQGAELSTANLQGVDLANAQLQGTDLMFTPLQGAVVWDTAFQQVYLPSKVNVAYGRLPFSMENANWMHIGELAKYIPSGKGRDAYVLRVNKAKAQKFINLKKIQNTFVSLPDVALSEIILAWDNDNNLGQKSVLSAARGLRNNYAEFLDAKNCLKNVEGCHPEYLEKINQAFCASMRMKELCEPQR